MNSTQRPVIVTPVRYLITRIHAVLSEYTDDEQRSDQPAHGGILALHRTPDWAVDPLKDESAELSTS